MTAEPTAAFGQQTIGRLSEVSPHKNTSCIIFGIDVGSGFLKFFIIFTNGLHFSYETQLATSPFCKEHCPLLADDDLSIWHQIDLVLFGSRNSKRLRFPIIIFITSVGQQVMISPLEYPQKNDSLISFPTSAQSVTYTHITSSLFRSLLTLRHRILQILYQIHKHSALLDIHTFLNIIITY